MALAKFSSYISYPMKWPLIGLATNASVIVAAGLNGSTASRIGWLLRATRTGNLRKVYFVTGTINSNFTVLVRIETVSGGNPTATLWSTSTEGSQALVATTDNNTVFGVTLAADAALTLGDRFAVVLRHGVSPAGNGQVISIGGDLSITSPADIAGQLWVDASSTWAKNANFSPHCMLEYDDGTMDVIPGVFPFRTTTAVTGATSASTPDEIGIKFTVPVPCRFVGAWMYGSMFGAGDIVLYDASDNVLSTITVTHDVQAGSNARISEILFPTKVTLTPGNTYRLVFKPGASGNLAYRYVTIQSAAHMAAFDGGTNVIYTERTNAGSWTDTDTRRTLIGCLVDRVSDSILVNPGIRTGGSL